MTNKEKLELILQIVNDMLEFGGDNSDKLCTAMEIIYTIIHFKGGEE